MRTNASSSVQSLSSSLMSGRSIPRTSTSPGGDGAEGGGGFVDEDVFGGRGLGAAAALAP